jgi:hypothetical protein
MLLILFNAECEFLQRGEEKENLGYSSANQKNDGVKVNLT